MRKTYIIILEFGPGDIDGENPSIMKMLESIGLTLRLAEHAFLMASFDTVTIIRDAIKNSPYDIERIFVSEVNSPAAWRNLVAENNDVKSFLRNEL